MKFRPSLPLSPFAATLLLALALTGCGGGGSGGATASAPDSALAMATGTTLRELTFTDAQNWAMRAYTVTEAQGTPVDGLTRYREIHTAQVAGGLPYSWGAGSSPEQGADMHWNGTAWVSCPLDFESTSTPWSAQGQSTYNYCDNHETGTSQRVATDISGQSMQAVYSQIQSAGYTNLTLTTPTATLGGAQFPDGSVLYTYSSQSAIAPPTYSPGTDALAYAVTPSVAAGNTSTGDVTAPCTAVANAPISSYASPANTLEELVAANQSTPCHLPGETVVNASGTRLSSSTNLWWNNSTLNLGRTGSKPTSASPGKSYYTGNTPLQVGFSSGTGVTYYKCQERFDGAVRNCKVVGTGHYSIQTLGDARLFAFQGLPAEFTEPTYQRTYIERSGKVYNGFVKKPSGPTRNARLNLVAANALLTQLGLPALNPAAPITLGAGSYTGSYSGSALGTGAGAGTWTFTISPSGASSCTGNSTSLGTYTYTFNLSPPVTGTTSAAIQWSAASSGATYTGTLDFGTGLVNGTWSLGTDSGSLSGSRL
jgi:hypothetical protein